MRAGAAVVEWLIERAQLSLELRMLGARPRWYECNALRRWRVERAKREGPD
jgi:hypothetical protein